VTISLRKGLLVLGASAMFLVNVACHTSEVSIVDNAFVPENVDSSQGVEVFWTNNGTDTHNVTSSGKGVFFDSPDLLPSEVFEHGFAEAGTYKYKCTLHPTEMTGSVQIPVLITNMSPPAKGDNVEVTWASFEYGAYTIPDGFNSDVQLDKPGRGGFEDWRINQKGTETSDTFVAKKTGTYRVRARLQKGNGPATAYSTPVEVVIPQAP
jgi:plastocyanin